MYGQYAPAARHTPHSAEQKCDSTASCRCYCTQPAAVANAYRKRHINQTGSHDHTRPHHRSLIRTLESARYSSPVSSEAIPAQRTYPRCQNTGRGDIRTSHKQVRGNSSQIHSAINHCSFASIPPGAAGGKLQSNTPHAYQKNSACARHACMHSGSVYANTHADLNYEQTGLTRKLRHHYSSAVSREDPSLAITNVLSNQDLPGREDGVGCRDFEDVAGLIQGKHEHHHDVAAYQGAVGDRVDVQPGKPRQKA